MAHFAELNADNLVLRVLVTDNDDPNGDEGYQWLISTFGGTWIKTSYNGTIRKNYAGIGYTYDESIDAFIPPQLFSSWVLNPETARWEAPVAYPTDGQDYIWNEETLAWDLVELSTLPE